MDLRLLSDICLLNYYRLPEDPESMSERTHAAVSPDSSRVAVAIIRISRLDLIECLGLTNIFIKLFRENENMINNAMSSMSRLLIQLQWRRMWWMTHMEIKAPQPHNGEK